MYITLSTFKISTSHMVLNKPTISFVDSCINFHMVGLYHVKKGAYVSCSLLTTYIKKKWVQLLSYTSIKYVAGGLYNSQKSVYQWFAVIATLQKSSWCHLEVVQLVWQGDI